MLFCRKLMATPPLHAVLQLLIILLFHAYFLQGQSEYHPTASNVSSSWMIDGLSTTPHGLFQMILSNTPSGIGFACGFFSDSDKQDSFYLVIVSAITGGANFYLENVIWSANRNKPVGWSATLQLLSDGNLVLRDADGILVWSTNTANRSIVGMKMMETGNLVLHDRDNKPVWQSFDHPTDTLLPSQKLVPGQKLVAAVSETNRSEGSFHLSVTSEGVFAFYQTNIPQKYFIFPSYGRVEGLELTSDKSNNGTLALYIWSASYSDPNRVFTSPVKYSTIAYMKLDPDGYLRIYKNNMNEAVDLLVNDMSECDYPTSCGNYGLCSHGRCSCPEGFVRDLNYPGKFGCSVINPATCENPGSQSLLTLPDIYYFNYIDPDAATLKAIDKDSCKQACLKNCSCKAAFFWYFDEVSHGYCFLPSPVLSLINDGRERYDYGSYAFIKISSNANISNGESGRDSHASALHIAIISGSTIGTFFLVCLIIGFWIVLLRKRKNGEEGMEDYLDQLSGIPTRFTYKELKVATRDFQKKLGAGGFGSVFEGILENGQKIAVKRLDALGQGKKEFFAEVKTIGSIHHVNLVKLIGFCADKFHRLLVYDFMCNGSLDKWIFYREPTQPPLDWQQRRTIVLDIAKGLAYLHEECRQRVVHLDIKPQNILLDAELHAKISDFGLSKLIDMDQSQVVTTIRGTPGYLAPEWFSLTITEKVDVYSFGIVVMETACGRKNLDRLQPEEHMHLLTVFMKKAEEDQLIDMVDRCSDDMQLHSLEVVAMMRLAIWCLQSDFTKRPSMSTAVKVLEGMMDVEPELDYSTQNPTMKAAIRQPADLSTTATMLPSFLSGPR